VLNAPVFLLLCADVVVGKFWRCREVIAHRLILSP